MTNFNLSIEGHHPYTGVIELDTSLPKILYRIPHDIERDSNGNYVHGKRDGKPRDIIRPPGATNVFPEPFRAWPDQTVPVKNNPSLLQLHYQANPEYTHERANLLWGTGLCWCNAQWGVYSAAIITGGNVLEAVYVASGKVYFKSILCTQPAPTLQQAKDNFLLQTGTSINVVSGDLGIMMRANGNGTRSQVKMLITRKTVEPLWFYESTLHKLPAGFVPPSPIWLP